MLKADELLDIVKSRRSIRFFKHDPVSNDDLMLILESARWAPSPANAQPWNFIVINDSDAKKELVSTMAKVGSAVKKRYPDFPWREHSLETPRDPKLLMNVPVIVAVCADYSKEELLKYDVFSLQHKKDIVNMSVAAALQNMMLMATTIGIGSLWLTPVFTEEIQRLLCIPETMRLIALLALGYPISHKVGKAFRRPLETMVYYNRLN